jgi:F0F1-type ATP synthase membrane subunit c/vacuolar-type H+-ATPase subunit K
MNTLLTSPALYYLHYGSIASLIILPSLGVGRAQGLMTTTTINQQEHQPGIFSRLQTILYIGLGINETASLLGTLVGLLLITSVTLTYPYQAFITLGIAFAVAVPGLLVSIYAAPAAANAFEAIARQPRSYRKILMLFIITQSVIQAPVILGLLIGIILTSMYTTCDSLPLALKYCASGLTMGISAIGVTFGLGKFMKTVCYALGINNSIHAIIVPFLLVSQTLIETPILFAFIISLIMILTHGVILNTAMSLIFFASAIAMGLTTINTGLSSSKTASAACLQIAQTPNSHHIISRTCMLSQTMIDICMIFGFIISILMIVNFFM